ncbi:MAG: uracil-DNA glycosylase family protein [Spirochaetales bacterium]
MIGGTGSSQTPVEISRALCERVSQLSFSSPVHTVYNPLEYAWEMHREYLKRYGSGEKHVLFVGMNPGPWGMAQTGVPFGEVSYVRDWLGLSGAVVRPANEHPARPVGGLDCRRSEVSGRRLWGLFADRFVHPEAFFDRQMVHNFCPLLFLEESGRNRTPDKLPATERAQLLGACDESLGRLIAYYRPRYVVGIGAFATAAAARVVKSSFDRDSPEVVQVLHPSPASPKANRGWAEEATRTLEQAGVWQAGSAEAAK